MYLSRCQVEDVSPDHCRIKGKCHRCHKPFVVEDVDIAGLERWKNGKMIQSCLPSLSRDARELLLSGTCSSCWEELYKDPNPSNPAGPVA